jgi:topoisomerase-4 subunit A
VAEKVFVGKNILHVAVFKKNDSRTIYNVVYRDGRQGQYFIKRFNVTSMTRDKEYDLTQGTPNSRVVYFTSNPNGEAEIIKITLDPTAKAKKLFLEKDFSEVIIKGRASKGNLLSKHPISRISLKSHGHSTLGGRKVWFDPDVKRLNYDEHGNYLGEFNDEDQILVILDNGDFYLTNFDLNNHYEDNILRLEKYQPDKVWTAILFDADQQGYPYLKRFLMDASKRKQNWLSENINSRLVLLTDQVYPRIKVTFGGNDAFRDPMEIEAEEFVGVKGFKAHGKRISTWTIESVEELEPLRFPEPENDEDGDEEDENGNDENINEEAPTAEAPVQTRHFEDETGQLSLFPDEE